MKNKTKSQKQLHLEACRRVAEAVAGYPRGVQIIALAYLASCLRIRLETQK